MRVIFTESTLYVGVICYDRDPGSITVSGSRRDSSLDDSDSIQIIHTICSDSRWPVSWLASGSGRGAAQPQDHPVCCRRPRSQRRASGDDDRVDVGVDLKYAVTPSLTLDLTCTTDFAQVEVDRIESPFAVKPRIAPRPADVRSRWKRQAQPVAILMPHQLSCSMLIVLDPSKLVRQARQRARLSQRALAARAKTTQSVVARLESGVTDPSSETLSRILGAAGYEVRCELGPVPVVESHMLDDVPRILSLTAEQRLVEMANLAAFEASVRRA